jgi:hypothetical protein
MTSGWSNDQFFNIGQGGEGGTAATLFTPYISASPPNNPPFPFPVPNLRVQDKNGNVQIIKMQRGYIRTLMTESDGVALAMRKCRFQFNPQVLSTSVQMNENMINMLQQDIGQYSVPIAGNSNFAFQLSFDRSMELNTPGSGGGDLNGDTGVYTDLSPSDIGVFRDIGDLSAVIGAGINPSSVDYAKKVLAKQIATQSAANKVDSATYDNATGLIDSFVGIGNVGNTAFLQPVPVRAVFSSLFIVEGFVTNIEIAYFKFNSALVPMQATVNLMMHATYIGYAKKKTFTTLSIDAQKSDYVAAIASQQSTAVSTVQALRSAFSSIDLCLISTLNAHILSLNEMRTATSGVRPPVVLSWQSSTTGIDIMDTSTWSLGGISSLLASASTDDTSVSIDASWKVYGPSTQILSGFPTTPFIDAKVHTDVAAWSHLTDPSKVRYINNAQNFDVASTLAFPNIGKVKTNTSTSNQLTLSDQNYRYELDVTVVVTPSGGPPVTGHGTVRTTATASSTGTSNLVISVPMSWDIPVIPGSDPYVSPIPNRDGVFFTNPVPPHVTSGLPRLGKDLPGGTSSVGSP